jgi:hypothetical protein
MSRQGRRHRLPQHHDYVLVPAPQDFASSKEKAALPAVIITPSSPQCSGDFSVAFLAPAPKPSLLQRAASTLSPVQDKVLAPLQTKARLAFVLVLFLFLGAAHLFAHRLAARHPHLQFDATTASISSADVAALAPIEHSHGHGHGVGLFDWRALWDKGDTVERHEFVVSEEGKTMPALNAELETGEKAIRVAEADAELMRAEAAAR